MCKKYTPHYTIEFLVVCVCLQEPPLEEAPYETLPWNNPWHKQSNIKIMVKIIAVKKSANKEGKEFFSLKVQGGVEAIQSQQTGKIYLTVRNCYVSTTFDEATAEALIGTELPGIVKRVESEPYEYTVKGTGEVIMLSHRYEYTPENEQEYSAPKEQKHEAFLAEL